jgi:enterochelin esterase-like enzyme
MSPDSAATLWVVIAAAVLAAVAVGALWSVGRGRTRLAVRASALAVCVSLAAASGLVWVNRLVDVIPDWASLVGGVGTVAVPATDASASGGGRVISFTVDGTHSGLRLPMYAYLPAAYRTHPSARYPVIEALDGYPGSPMGWLRALRVVRVLDGEIAAGRMAPTVVLFPYQTPSASLDTECTNLVGGPQAETFLTVDVPAVASARLPVRPDPAAWGLIGYSAGGYCTTDLLLRHPGRYEAGASLSGYLSPGIKIGNGTENTTYNDVWRLRHLPVPAVALYLACARNDVTSLRQTDALMHAAKAPLSVTTALAAGGGHNGRSWQAMMAPAFDWLSGWLAKPLPGAATKDARTAPVPGKPWVLPASRDAVGRRRGRG